MDFDFDNDFEDVIKKYFKFLEEMELMGYVEKDGNKVDRYGYPVYIVTKKGRNRAVDIELKYTGRLN